MAQTPSHNNPGYYEITVQEPVPGTVDPATGFISGGGTQTVVKTYRDDGTFAYKEAVGQDGTRTLIGSVGNEVKNGQTGDVATPDGIGFKRETGFVVPANDKPVITHETPSDAGKIIADDPGFALKQFKETALDKISPSTQLGVDSGLNKIINTKLSDGVNSLNGKNPDGSNKDGSVGPGDGFGGNSDTAPGATGAGGGTGGGGSINTDAIAAAAAASRAMSDKFLAAYNDAHPNQPPTMTAAQLPPAAQAEMMAQIKAAQAAGLDPIHAAQADKLDPFSASHATASQLDPTLQAEQRGRQVGLEDDLGNVIAGKGGPSVAELQLRAAEQRQEANQLGLASKASGGGNVALALRTAANNIGRLNQGSSADAALLRAQEIDAARARLGGVIDQTRGADINLADRNATLTTDVSKTNAGLDTSATLKTAELEAARRAANAGLTTGAATKDAELEASRRAGNAGLTTSAALKDAELEAARRASNVKEVNDRNANQGTLDNTAASNNLTAGLKQQEIDAAAKDAAAKNAIAAGGQVITGTVGAAQAQAQAIAAAQAAKNAKDAKDAAWLGAISTVGAAALA